ncbi:hypothetical protein CDL15_Pgr016350 [Punica granatum]|uniref:Uncharacterized protein n=1 Tax=Punica granatum TaxID=22663 RepID=A0A218W754_PUNGR|nr:hypothetical protein CDL15_Pgr016350 [Punica granatum]
MALRIFALFSSIIIATILLGRSQYTAAARPLPGEPVYPAVATLRSSLQKGKVPLSGNPCTNIPGRGSGVCRLAEKDFAGSQRGAHVPLPANPMTQSATSFQVASVTNETTEQKAAHQSLYPDIRKFTGPRVIGFETVGPLRG